MAHKRVFVFLLLCRVPIPGLYDPLGTTQNDSKRLEMTGNDYDDDANVTQL